MDQSSVRYEQDGAVATVTLAAPERHNRLTADMTVTLRDHLRVAVAEDGVRVIVLAAEGSTFCAGADLSAGEQFSDAVGTMVEVLETMLDSPKPVVARVQGHVAGGGNGLVAASDLAVAARTARFAFSEVRVGVAPAVISVPCLARMNPADAHELMLTGARVSAERVHAAGLVHQVVPPEGLDEAVREYVDALLQAGPQALGHTKELLRRVPQMTRDEAFAWTAELSSAIFRSAEGQEGMAAYVEKRAARWVPPPRFKV